VIEFAGRKIYFTGDTCYNEAMMAPVIAEQPEIVIPCINGAFGNLSEFDGAKLTAACNARIAIPSHFWLFAEHGGDPGKFRAHVTELSDAQTILLTPGRGVEI
jgi:L-ascorbate 6-phosphate lactonase